jgi:hypothetical protein
VLDTNSGNEFSRARMRPLRGDGAEQGEGHIVCRGQRDCPEECRGGGVPAYRNLKKRLLRESDGAKPDIRRQSVDVQPAASVDDNRDLC